ncbi:CHAT domain-containing protein [Lutibacter sp. Hel_I_33_5]|uniref:CHAT domain-containing protein n=1 Tax=Lutibacter sp. Hel_I_33_5 TaxID=1566289 RepID=UPI0011A8CEFC|nr:CHAT domain-containing protein [Lutibacter sp. Hel_I_33_5]TVZ57181.1 CHAT domain-containing protein [Lutibacter sp. Hel_I_33_5]
MQILFLNDLNIMKQKIIILIVIFFTMSLNAQDLNTLFTKAAEAVKNKNIPNLKVTANSLIKKAPENYAGYLYLAFVNCLENDVVSATTNARTSLNINYIDASNFAILSYISFLNGELEASKKQMDFSYALISYPNALTTTLDDINWIEKETGKDCTLLKEYAKSANTNNSQAILKAQKLFTSFSDWQKGKNYANEKEIENYLASKGNYGKTALSVYKFLKGVIFYNNNKINFGVKAINQFLENPLVRNNENLQYQVAQAYSYLADNSYYSYDYENMLNEANKGLQILKKFKTDQLELILLNNKLKALTGLQKKKDIVATANSLLRKGKEKNNTYFQALANNSLGQYYSNSVISTDRNKAFQYTQKAYNQSVELNNKNLISDISGNYSISLWQKNQKQKAKEVALKAIDIKEELKDVSGAQLLANNIGFMSYMSKDYTNASKMFSKAINLSEKHLENSDPDTQLGLMNEYTSAYSGLIMTYKDTRNVHELFKVQDANRSRLLSKKLHQKAFGKNIIDVQNKLTNDDALIYYSLLGPGEMVATVITKNNKTIKYNFPIDTWLKLKKRFVNLVKKKPNTINNHLIKMDEDIIDGQLIKYKDKKQAFSADDFNVFTSLTRQLMETADKKNAAYLDQFLKHWYSFLVAPIANDINGKKNLIISGEGELNYLPFEAFKNNSNKYLLENYNITYIPSVTVWSKLKERKYSSSRKSLLAFGGATYYPPANKGGKSRSKKDYYAVKKDLSSKIKTNTKNLSEELSAFGFGGANYLPGTLREVNNLKKIITNATVLTGNYMTESGIKKMNTTGELANYKWVHIATHGFASDNNPALSGVMMTQNESEKNKGEDTFLLAYEIEKLNLNADMVVLSACQTALGKIYGGEGINGLNSSLLVAGANNTLLSLWPVNDAGTMILMTLMYQNMYLKNQPASLALTNAKRAMLKGEVGENFKSVYMWAPFVLNGSGE